MPELPREIQSKVNKLLDRLNELNSVAVAYSGGLDSSVLAKAAHLALGERAVAVTAFSASLAEGELDEARRLAAQIGIRHEIVHTAEMNDPVYLANPPDRCYYCKAECLRQIDRIAKKLGSDVIVDGSNVDDVRDHRPGRRAAREQNVVSPLAECGFNKIELRALAAHWNVAACDKPSAPCLSSRIAYGEAITPERLAMVDRAERFLRDHGFDEVRVRYHHDGLARIEVLPDAIAKLAEPQFRRELLAELKDAGFSYITLDLQGFRSGSLNETLPSGILELGESNRPR